uniref:hypothetical protein n=1 Tax=Castellaniella defragrans TaxID=75697 RepID=UPI0033414574
MNVTRRIKNLTRHIKQERDRGTIAGFLPCVLTSVTEAASKFGLTDASECYKEIDDVEAVMVLTRVLHNGLAYTSDEIMPLAEARNLAASFIAEFSNVPARFFTNGNWGSPRAAEAGRSWHPATSSTFDAGVVVLSDHGIGCVWCMDED